MSPQCSAADVVVGICSGIFAFKLSQDRNVAPERRLLALLARDREARQAGAMADGEGGLAMTEFQKLLEEQQQQEGRAK